MMCNNTLDSRLIRIAIDQDQVLADLLSEWLRRYNNDYNDNLKKEQVNHWNWHDLVKPECGKKIYDYLDDPDLFESLPVIEDAQEVVKELSEKFDIFIVTAPWNMNNVIPKYKWLKKHFSFLDDRNFVFTRNKSIIDAEWLIDDKPSNLDDFAGSCILFDAPHNRDVTKYMRVLNWEEVREYFSIEIKNKS